MSAASNFATWWTKERVAERLALFVKNHSNYAPGSNRYDTMVQAVCKGKQGVERTYPLSSTVRKYWPTMADAWRAIDVVPSSDCQDRGRRAKRTGRPVVAQSVERVEAPVDVESFASRLDALESDRTSLLRVVGLLVEDGPNATEYRELVRAGIAVGAMGAGGRR